ncbi:unnamed protein product [Paramecium sonneborni]|uniref:Uncharacterized protein n=1 Tax=Paramecium sonneborni TaxID=65129 RepID=A0A8S1LY67_9CILI|nr:unnamed protein product [Paramecium sonneborni]
MIYSNENRLSGQQSIDQQTIQKEVYSFNYYEDRMEKLKIQIKFTSDQQIIYSQNQAILRMQIFFIIQNKEYKAIMFLKNQKCLKIQIKSTIFYGKVSMVKKKMDGQWIAFWNKVLIKNVGGQRQLILNILYYKEGQKQGLWKDLFLNYQK